MRIKRRNPSQVRSFTWTAVLCLVLLTAATAVADREWISLDGRSLQGTQPHVTTLSSSNSQVVLSITLPGFWMEDIMAEGTIYDRIAVPGTGTTEEIGLPMLPVVRTLLAIPESANLNASIETGEVEVFDDVQVFPFQTPLTDLDEPVVLDIDRSYYSSGLPYPEQEVELSEPGMWRSLPVSQAAWNPFVYDPTSRILAVAKTATVTIEFAGGASGGSDPIGRYPVHERFVKSYENLVVNFDKLNVDVVYSRGTDDTTEYLVITDPDFNANAKLVELVAAHTANGLNVTIVDTNTTGSTTTAIKNYITTMYESESPPRLTYVLFVGDVDAIPLYSWSGNYSDSWYTFLAGGDMYAEISLGRMPAKDDEDLNWMIDKTLDFMDGTYSGDWLQKSVLIAHSQNYPGKYTECKESIRTYSYVFDAPTFDTVYGGQSSPPNSNQDAIDAIEEGRVIVNYRGHGSSSSWSGWDHSGSSFTNAMAHDLVTNGKTPIVYSIACHNGGLQSSGEVLAEAFMIDDDGAVAFLAATMPSYTVPNHDFDRFLYRAPFDKGISDIGLILMDANAELFTLWGSGSLGETNIKMYLWLGDPAIDVPVSGLLSPTGLDAAADGEAAIDLSWTDRTADEDGFEVEYRTPEGSWAQLDVVGPDVVTYEHSGLSEATEMYYRVRAYKGGDVSLYSNTAHTATLPQAPSGLYAQTLVGGQVYLAWTDNSAGEDGYILERAVGEKLDFAELAVLSEDATSYTDSALGECETYSYRVHAYTVGGNSADAGPVVATTLASAPSDLLAEAVGSDTISLSWADNSAGETGYRVYGKKLSDADYEEYALLDADTTEYDADSLDEATTYSFKICAVNAGGDSPPTNDSQATTFPVAPDGLDAHGVSETTIGLSWTDNSSGEVGYRIERLVPAKDEETYEVVGVVGADVTEFEDSTLSEATSATYRVKAFTDLNESEASATATAASLPAAPSDLIGVAASETSIEITWVDNSSGEEGYIIERAPADDSKADFEEVTRVDADVMFFQDEGLVSGTTYVYRVAAYLGADLSVYSDEAEVTTEGEPPEEDDDDDDDDDDDAGCCG